MRYVVALKYNDKPDKWRYFIKYLEEEDRILRSMKSYEIYKVKGVKTLKEAKEIIFKIKDRNKRNLNKDSKLKKIIETRIYDRVIDDFVKEFIVKKEKVSRFSIMEI